MGRVTRCGRRFFYLAVVTTTLALAGNTTCLEAADDKGGQENPLEITLKVVKYDQLVEAVKACRGQVLVVDVWGTFCIPCRHEFPNLVQLYHRHQQDGVVCFSVSVDTIDKQEAALAFLKKVGATFPNFLLNEEAEVWQKKWGLEGVPAVFVFDRQGQLVHRFDADDPAKSFTYADVEKLVQELLQRGS